MPNIDLDAMKRRAEEARLQVSAGVMPDLPGIVALLVLLAERVDALEAESDLDCCRVEESGAVIHDQK